MGIHSLVRVTGIQHMRQPDYTVHTFSIVWSSFGVDNLRACNENRFGDIQWGSMVLSGRAKESPFPHTPPSCELRRSSYSTPTSSSVAILLHHSATPSTLRVVGQANFRSTRPPALNSDRWHLNRRRPSVHLHSPLPHYLHSALSKQHACTQRPRPNSPYHFTMSPHPWHLHPSSCLLVSC